ncbi:PREDICTED: natural killer cells antigen CD94-like [Chrysochloris asiatica]|uniref:Natural killer cells antigen CD94 n=1 Tax=Chrysochloris asiatica TaxID=185453 RepID=A0A9B0UA74_CHRAS|nr:PREDICTED: natural killer cells antigen CD94-like [Chrysochloris asiatica]
MTVLSNKNLFLFYLYVFALSFLCTVFQTTPWRLISGILGVLCLLLMIALGILLHKYTDCPEKWIGYRCNCYLIFNEGKNWTESRNSCASQNSSLLYLESKDELDFWKHSEFFYWVGLSYNKANGTWLWEDGSALSRNLFPSFQNSNPEECISFNPKGYTLSETCRKNNRFICKKWPI